MTRPTSGTRSWRANLSPIAIHASYLVNLAGPEDDFFARSIDLLVAELLAAPGFLGRYVNVHVGSHRGSGVEAGTVRLADGIAAVLGQVDDGPDAADARPRELGRQRIRPGNGRHGAGGHRRGGRTPWDRATSGRASAWTSRTPGVPGSTCPTRPRSMRSCRDFDARIGLDRLVMVHLNDSKVERGSHLDRHEHLGAGQIGETGLAHLVRHPLLKGATYYLETPGMDDGYDAINVARAYDLAAGRPLATLPPEAFLVRGSRARTAPATAKPEPEPEPV